MGEKLLPAERRAHLEELETKAYEAFVLQAEEAAIDIRKFEDKYPAKEIAHDQAYVADRQGKFNQQERSRNRRGKILEALIFVQSELNNWFGDNAFTVKTSTYDDIANGVDLVIELVDHDGVSRLALAIDVASTEDEEYLTGKLLKIKKEVEEGRLSTVKYFQSEAQEDFKEPLLHIPRVVLAADTKTYQSLLELSVENKREELATHQVQRQFLEEIGLQLARLIPFSSGEASKKLTTALTLIQGILKGKENISTNFRHEDQAYVMLRSILDRMAQEKKSLTAKK
ncbi:MAG: hypothetical protein Q7S32_00415 [bacterium]|nr:hypothetical protein [bacterium]